MRSSARLVVFFGSLPRSAGSFDVNFQRPIPDFRLARGNACLRARLPSEERGEADDSVRPVRPGLARRAASHIVSN